ncbi:MAG: ABC transporter substrate-binding protein [Candidatus Accumulibacter sp.]|jgi:ABC-type nitrate/sulfonate/bicarbonate transport system substrate-binding protein|nr:ABC transporter substrate-binding protein [Accumulibacter sp.]
MSKNSVKTKLLGSLLAIGVLSGPAFAADQKLSEINLQKSPWTVVALEKGFFKEEFDKVGIKKINLVPASSAELLGAESAAVGGGALALAQRMIYPATVQRANGIDAVVVWVSEPSNRYRAPILARANNDKINSAKDLDGKKLGSSRVSCYWSSPFETLTLLGLPLDSRLGKGRVRYENIDNPSVAVAAVISGDLDATAGHLAAAQFTGPWLSGNLKVVDHSADDGVYVNNGGRVTYFARRDFVNKYPEVIQATLVARERARAWTYDHVADAAQIVAKELRLPIEVATFQITHLGQWDFMGGEANAERARNSLKTFQDWYIKNGDDILVDRHLTDEQITAFIDGRFFVGGSHSIYK